MTTPAEIIKLIFPSVFTDGKYNGDFSKIMILSRPLNSRRQIYELFTKASNSEKSYGLPDEMINEVIDCVEEDSGINALTSTIVPIGRISYAFSNASQVPADIKNNPKFIVRGRFVYRIMNKLFDFDVPKHVRDIHDAGNQSWFPKAIVYYNEQIFGTSEFNINQHVATSHELESISKSFEISHIISLRLLKLLPEFHNLKLAADILIHARSRFTEEETKPIFMSKPEFYSALLNEIKPATLNDLIHSLNDVTDVNFINAAFYYAVSQPALTTELQNTDNEIIKRISNSSEEYKMWLVKYPLSYTTVLLGKHIHNEGIVKQIIERAIQSHAIASAVRVEVPNAVLSQLDHKMVCNLIIPLYKYARVSSNVNPNVINSVVEEKYSEHLVRECIRFYALQKKVDEIPEKIRKWMYLSNLYEVMRDVIQNMDNTETLKIAKDLVRVAKPDYTKFGVMRKYEPEKMAVTIERRGASSQSRMTLPDSRSPPPIDFGTNPYSRRYSPPPLPPFPQQSAPRYNPPCEHERYTNAISPIQCDDSYEVTLRNLASYVDRTGNTLALTALVNKQRLLPVELLHSPLLQTGIPIQEMWQAKMQRPPPEELQSHDMFELKLKEVQDVTDPSGTNIYELHHGVEKPCWIFVEGSRILNHIYIEKLKTVHIPYDELAKKITHTRLADIGELTTCPADIWKLASMGRSIRYVAIAFNPQDLKDPTSKRPVDRLLDLLDLLNQLSLL